MRPIGCPRLARIHDRSLVNVVRTRYCRWTEAVNRLFGTCNYAIWHSIKNQRSAFVQRVLYMITILLYKCTLLYVFSSMFSFSRYQPFHYHLIHTYRYNSIHPLHQVPHPHIIHQISQCPQEDRLNRLPNNLNRRNHPAPSTLCPTCYLCIGP